MKGIRPTANAERDRSSLPGWLNLLLRPYTAGKAPQNPRSSAAPAVSERISQKLSPEDTIAGTVRGKPEDHDDTDHPTLAWWIREWTVVASQWYLRPR